MTVEKPKPKQLLRPITTGAGSAMNQSQFLAITCDSLEAHEKSRVPRNSPSIMQYLVSDIQSFARNNNMCLNPTKCREISIDFLQYNGHVRLPITTGGTEIGCVKSFKLLGVYLSSDLTWATHVDYVLKKANRRLYALRQLKRCGVLPADIVKVYCSLVRSVVEYASVVFSNLPQYLVDALEKLQKRALKIIYPNYRYEAALDAANLEKLECRRVNICSSFVSKLTKSNPVYNLVSGRLKSRTVRYNLRVKQSTTTKLKLTVLGNLLHVNFLII